MVSSYPARASLPKHWTNCFKETPLVHRSPNIKYSFSKDNEVATIGNLGTSGGVLTEGILKTDDKSSYSLKLWIKAEATNEIMNQHFHGLIKVEAIQSDQELPVND